MNKSCLGNLKRLEESVSQPVSTGEHSPNRFAGSWKGLSGLREQWFARCEQRKGAET
jgi:hypothetical protein